MNDGLRRFLIVSVSVLPWLLGLWVYLLPTSRPPTRLMEAVRLNRGEEVDALLARGVDVNEKASHGSTALWAAVDTGNLELAKRLVRAGANVNERRDGGDFLLMSAVSYASAAGRSPAVVELLVSHGADVRARTLSGGRTALHLAAPRDPSGQVVKVLLAAGADPNASDCSGSTPIGLAVAGSTRDPARGNVDVIRRLLEAGAQPPPDSLSRIQALTDNDKRVLALVSQTTVAVPKPYREGPCRVSEGLSSEAVRARKEWGDRLGLPLPYGAWEFLSGWLFSLLAWFAPPFVLLLAGLLTEDRLLELLAGALLGLVIAVSGITFIASM